MALTFPDILVSPLATVKNRAKKNFKRNIELKPRRDRTGGSNPRPTDMYKSMPPAPHWLNHGQQTKFCRL